MSALPCEYRSLVYPGRSQPFHEWLNEHCKKWEVIDIRSIPGSPRELAVTMRRPLPENDEISFAGRMPRIGHLISEGTLENDDV